jgi:hypothetical protein
MMVENTADLSTIVLPINACDPENKH